jgi:ketosteroid isomerase-like protein
MKTNCNDFVLMLSLVAAFGFAQDKQISPALSAIFDAERAFAKRCGEVGIRASFTEFFADDGIAFYPQPVKYKEAIKGRPAPPNPMAYSLVWEPVFGDVAAAGDLGYDCGPSVSTDKTKETNPPRYGFFFSVWKKQADGNWKVALDIGTDTKAPYSGSREPRSARTISLKTTEKTNVETERSVLSDVERAFSKISETEGLKKAYTQHLSDEARLHRDGTFPLTTHDEIISYLSKNSSNRAWQTMFAEVSQSGDFGYTYGSYESKAANSQDASVEKGFYARVWKKDQSNKWKLVADIVKPQPAEEK